MRGVISCSDGWHEPDFLRLRRYEYEDDEGYKYYYNAATEASTYDAPPNYHAAGTFET